ncbi:hypothetical protein CL614_01870 [archaeon]|nr:hypothetical protein [archaeon]
MSKSFKYFLNHPKGSSYSFLHYDDHNSAWGVQIKHNGKNCQDVIAGEHHSDGCYHVSDARNFWNSLVSEAGYIAHGFGESAQ